MLLDILLPVLILGGLGLLFGLGLGFASKKFAVETDPKFPIIRDALPGANCGGCGYAGCDAYAKAVAAGEAPIDACPVGGASVIEELGEIMGLKVEQKAKQVAFIKCAGTCDACKDKYTYEGIKDCRDAEFIPGKGPKSCEYGCLGYGSCVKACPFDAIDVVDGIAVVNEEKCTSCGKCVEACPRNLIDIVPYEQNIHVYCNNLDKGKDVKAICSVGCIGCRLCARVCPSDAIIIENNVSRIDYDKCTQCGACVEKCPTKSILNTMN